MGFSPDYGDPGLKVWTFSPRPVIPVGKPALGFKLTFSPREWALVLITVTQD
jgi:hypothetical protein